MTETVKPSDKDPLKKPDPKDWHPQQAKLLKGWAEIASSYRWMHNQAYMIYRKKNLWFMIPLIVMSTVTGTANFAQSTFPEAIKPYVPQMIGAINLISAILTTIYQFLKISEFMESHRISSINYGKLARTITVELSLPVKDRNSGGAECVKISRTEIDRLIEQSPAIPKDILYRYERQFAGRGLSEPEIVVINKVDIYEDKENKVAATVADAGIKFKSIVQQMKKPLFNIKTSDSPTEKRKEIINQELDVLRNVKAVSNVNTAGALISNVLNRFSPRKRPPPKAPEFTDITSEINAYPVTIPEEHTVDFTDPVEQVIPETVVTVDSSENTTRISDLINRFKPA